MSVAEFPRGNAVSFPISLSKGGTAITDLASATDIVVILGAKPAEPELTLTLSDADGKLTINSPNTGDLLVALPSTDTLNMSVKEIKAVVQIQYAADNSNNLEFLPATVFKLTANYIAPAST